MKKLTAIVVALAMCSIVAFTTEALAQSPVPGRTTAQAEKLLKHYFVKKYFIEDKMMLIDELTHSSTKTSLSKEEINLYLSEKIRWARTAFITDYVNGKVHASAYDVTNYFDPLIAEWKEELQQGKAKIPKEHQHGHAKQYNGPCVNMDFETCDFTGWDLYQGTVNANPMEMVNPVLTTPGTQHVITTAGTDPIVGISTINPNGGTCSVMLGDGTGTGGVAASMTQTFLVSNNNAVFTYSYALVLEDPSGHTTGEKPFFKVNMYDEQNNIIPCGEYSVIAGPVGSGGDPDFVAYNGGFYLPWRTTFAPLDGYLGQNVTIEFIIGDCSQSGHYGYGYIDANCSPLQVIAADTILCGGQGTTLYAPPGAADYLWSTGETTEQIWVTQPGTYDVTVTPVTGAQCAITLSITIQGSPGVPTADFIMVPNPACINDQVNFTDQSWATQGAFITNWEWDFGDGNTSTIQYPTHTYATAGNYNVQLVATTDGGCTDTVVYPITIIDVLDPTITPAGPFCDYDAVFTMTAADAGGAWSASCGNCINLISGDFDPAIAGAGTHEIIYTITGTCGDADTVNVVVESINIDNVTVSNPLCYGDCDGSITIAATGADEYSIDGGATWQASNFFQVLCAGNYSLVVRNANGCTATGNANLIDPAPLSMSFSAFDASCYGYCDGYAIVIPNGGTSPYSFAWSSSANNTANENNLCAGNYSITITDDHGCSIDTNYAINEPPQLLITNIVTTDEVCFNDCAGSINITAPGAVNFSIDNGSTLAPNNVFPNLCAGVYNIYVEDAAGCFATAQTTINSIGDVSIVVSNDTIVCLGGVANINALASGGAGGFTYTWDNGLPAQTNHSVTPGVATTYHVFATDANGCVTATIPVVVDYFPPLNVQAFSDQAICFGDAANIDALAAGGNGGPYTYTWDNGLGNGQAFTVNPTSTTTYTVTAADNCETPDVTDQVTITVNPLPVVSFLGDKLEGCMPVTTNFTNTTDAQYIDNSCIWDFGDGAPLENDCVGPIHTFNEPGCYDVSLMVTSPEGCINDTVVPNYVCVYDYPVADFAFGPQPTTVLAPDIAFTDLSSEPVYGIITDYDWTFSNLGVDSVQHPVFSFPSADAGVYDVCLTVTSNYGCPDQVCKPVKIEGEMLIYVPNAFTPNGDGVNDVFSAQGFRLENSEEFTLYIFDRWGNLIFETDNPLYAWDGTRYGREVMQDVYVWRIIIRDPYKGKKHDLKGHVTVLR